VRIWTLHPSYLDGKGLVALWREGLLAQKVLQGSTMGYRNHPQLQRFRAAPDPEATIASYLAAVAVEAERRGYCFDVAKIAPLRCHAVLEETAGQLNYEWEHLLRKLQTRSPEYFAVISGYRPHPHPLFVIVPGGIRDWEKV
jgi:hypothetical protein